MRKAGRFDESLSTPTNIAGRQKGDAMANFQGEVIRDASGREVVRFTTPSGVQAIVATCIPPAALAKMARKLERKIARRQSHLAGQPKRCHQRGDPTV